MDETTLSISKPTILIVDDTSDNLMLLQKILIGDYRVRIANNGEKGIILAGHHPLPDLILLDIMMPDVNGYEVCRRLKNDPKTRDIPIIFLTALTDTESEEKGFELGAVDYITRPFSAHIVLARVKTHLAVKALAQFLHEQNTYLEKEVVTRTQEVALIQEVTIMTVASLAGSRVMETSSHIKRMQFYVKTLAEKLSRHARFAEVLNPTRIEALFHSVPLHDIGKVGIPDSILLKPSKLTHDEFEIMKTHTRIGWESLHHAEQTLDFEAQFLIVAKEIALSHHEKWDGSGYPQGLVGEQIPVAARLVAIADVYDALISRTVYKAPMRHEEARLAMIAQKGLYFDPDVLEAFLASENEFQRIASYYSDSESDLDEKKEYLRRAGIEGV